MTDDFMTIREMCDEFGVTARALRFYESKELLAPYREGQRRLYNKTDRARLKLILRGKRFGFSLEEIRQLLELYNVGDTQHVQIKRTMEVGYRRLADMEAQRDELTAAISDLKARLDWGEAQLAKEAAKSAG